VEQYFQETGEVLQPLDAAKHVESELELEAQKILKAKKFNKPQVQAEAPVQKESKNQATLTNSNASEMPVNGTKLLPRDESIRELAKTIRWIK
jgi:hypothetical protein